MCFIIRGKERIAQKNIICYKVGSRISEKIFQSQYREFLYNKNQKNMTVELKIENFVDVYEGYHSFSNKRDAISERYILNYKDSNASVAVFQIPKGAKYYRNVLAGEYVSNKIIFKGWVK